MSGLWGRVAEGECVVWWGPLTEPRGIDLVRVSCVGQGLLGPLDDAHEAILAVLGHMAPRWERAIDDVTQLALRRRVLGELAAHSIEAEFVSACNLLAERSKRPAAVLFEHIDAADKTTLEALCEILDQPGWLKLPLVFHADAPPQTVPLQALADSVQRRSGCAMQRPDQAPKPQVAPPSAPPASAPAFDFSQLPTPMLRVLRGAATLGERFEAAHLAQLLEAPEGEVLIVLQEAADAGVPLVDHGHGWFALPRASVAALKQRLLPSLETYWNRRAAALLNARPVEPSAVSPRLPPEAEQEDTQAQADPVPPAQVVHPYAALLENVAPAMREPEVGPEASAEDEEPVAPLPGQPRPSSWDRAPVGRDPARAAHHYAAAGDLIAATEASLEAASLLAQRGNTRRALALLQDAMARLEDEISHPQRALLRARLFLCEGQVRWRGQGLGPELTLQRAMAAFEEARNVLPRSAPAAIEAELCASIAGVCFDLGDLRSLERALEEFARASRVLTAAGDPTGAASFLNDQAAVLLRAGDAVRTTHLLQRSREVFEARRREDPEDRMAREELAQTEHLLAKLPLSARLKPGREDDAYSLALGHARAAEATYRELGQTWALGRVWETMGKLELRRNAHERAVQRLQAAGALQRRIGDLVGLARTAAAMSDVLVAADRPMDAIALLTESMELNLQKGSPGGLAFNRRALEVLRSALPRLQPGVQATVQAELERLETLAQRAESRLGRVTVP